jgi:Mn2+/Fe2+ NRAMP family transporter
LNQPPPNEHTTTPNHGCLPAWRQADLPEPLPFSLANLFRTIGPGAILLAAAIGGGEWIVGPTMVVKYGPSILWVATTAIVLQVIFNLEAVRYTMYTGEPILTGIMRLKPGPRFWSVSYVILALAQLATPALAAASATVLFTAFAKRLPIESDRPTVHWLATAIILISVAVLLSGKSIERVLERLSWAMLALIFLFLFGVNAFFVPVAATARILDGFLVPRLLPENMDLILLALFAATAGSGGIGNLVISNWFRDKGFAMARHVGGIGGVLAGDHQQLAATGCVFPSTEPNLARWRTWWRYAVLDQAALWGVGCFFGMFLNVNLMAAIVEPGTNLSGDAAGAYQAEYIERHLGAAFWLLTLLNGFWIVYSTHLGNTDGLVRTVCDVLWAGFPSVQRWSASRLYACLLAALTAFGLVAVRMGSVLSLFKVLGVIASPIMALAAVQILVVNTRLLPPALRPPVWRCVGLVFCAVVYGGLTVAMLADLFRKLW